MECPGFAAIDMIEDYTLSVAARLNTALQTGLRGQSQNTFEDFAPEWPFLQRIKTEKVDHARIMLQELQDTFGSIGSKQRQAMDDFIDNIAQL